MASDYIPEPVVGGAPTAAKYNAELAKIKIALDNSVSRQGGTPNQMEEDFDLNGHSVLNAAPGEGPNDLVTLSQVESIIGSGVDVGALADVVAQNSEDIADGFTATNAQVATNTAAIATEITNRAAVDSSLAAQIQANDAQIDVANAINTSQSNRLDALEAINAVDQATLDAAIANEVAIRQSVDSSLSAQINVEEARNDAQDTSITSLQSDVAAINAQLPDDDTALAQAIADNATAIANEINDTNTDVNAILATQAALQTSVNTNASAAAANAAAHATLSATVSDNQLIATTNSADITALEAEQITQNTAIIAAQADADAAQLDATANANAIATLSTTVGTIQSDVGDLQVKQVILPFTYDPIADGTEVMHFTAAEAFLLTNAGASHATARTAPPSAAAQWNILRNGVVVGTADWSLGNTIGTITGYTAVAPVTYAIGDVFSVEATTNNGIEAVSLTLLFQEAP